MRIIATCLWKAPFAIPTIVLPPSASCRQSLNLWSQLKPLVHSVGKKSLFSSCGAPLLVVHLVVEYVGMNATSDTRSRRVSSHCDSLSPGLPRLSIDPKASKNNRAIVTRSGSNAFTITLPWKDQRPSYSSMNSFGNFTVKKKERKKSRGKAGTR